MAGWQHHDALVLRWLKLGREPVPLVGHLAYIPMLSIVIVRGRTAAPALAIDIDDTARSCSLTHYEGHGSDG